MIDLATLRFGEPDVLWLLVVPAVLLLIWAWQLVRRRHDARRLRKRRELPMRERLHVVSSLLPSLCLLFAIAFTTLALGRPRVMATGLRIAPIDLVILQDGSSSMRVPDVAGDRWQRSMRFLRVLAGSLEWRGDRIAMALFAHIAAPQVRLTRDPNTFYFFLDHLDRQSPFRLEDDTTWDTNIELGIHWGVRLIEKDAELHGPSPNIKTFVLVSDGEAWSGKIERALSLARARDVPVYVVGVGTVRGGTIPEPASPTKRPELIHASLDRPSLMAIATAGHGQYFELDRESDRDIATAIIDATRRRAGLRAVAQTPRDLYWESLLAAALFLSAGMVSAGERTELWLQALGVALALAAFWRLVG